MVHKDLITKGIFQFTQNKIDIIFGNNPLIFIGKPIINKIISNKLDKLENILNLISDEKGMINVSEMVDQICDNLLVSAVKNYPTEYGNLEIGKGLIKLELPFIDDTIIFNKDDINELKNIILNKNE